MEPKESRRHKRFGSYEFDAENCDLKKDGVRLKVTGQPLQVLDLLTERPGELVTREELRQRLWPADTFVDFEHGLNTSIERLRQALGDNPDRPQYVETVPRRGYRFVAALEQPAISGADIAASPSQTAVSELRNRRRWYWVASAALAALLAAIGLLEYRGTPGSGARRVMLAVLPFKNLTGEPQQEYFSDGLTEETITDLSELSPDGLGVIARTSAMAYKQTSKTIGQIGQELGVDYVLEGSARRDGTRVRVSAQLIRVRDQTNMWARNYDREMHDVLALQNEIGSAIAQQVRIELTPAGKAKLTEVRYVDPDAYAAYLKGRHYWYQFRQDSLNQAIDYYQQALGKDPNYAPAYAGLASAYEVRANFFTNPSEDYPKARASAQRALELDNGLSAAHESMAAVHLFYDWDWVLANRELTRSEELGPTSGECALRAYWFETRNDIDGAVEVLKRGLRLDPFNPLLNAELGNAYYYGRRPDEAIAQSKKTFEIDPNFPVAIHLIAAAYEQKGDLSAAAAQYQRLGDSVSLAVLEAGQGKPIAARRLIADLKRTKEPPDPLTMTRLNIALGDNGAAINWLYTAYQRHAHWLIWLKVDPKYDALRSDPGFQDLLRIMRLPE